MQNTLKRLGGWAVLVAAILTIPLIANWPWTSSDFVFAVVMLFGSALVYELVSHRGGTTTYRLAVGIAVSVALLLMWINGAVGIIGDGQINALYLLVPAIGFLGAIITRLNSRGMARTLFAMAAVQMLIPIIAFLVNMPDFTPGVAGVLALNAFFTILFTGSGLLFKQASVRG